MRQTIYYRHATLGMIRITNFSPPDLRFWARVNKNGPVYRFLGNCWDWAGRKGSEGYGSLRVDGKSILAHRFSWMLHNGEIVDDLCVLHKCDRPICVNPNHLFTGDRVANNADRDSKGHKTGCTGVDHGRAKLNDAIVKEMRLRYIRRHPTHGAAAMAKEFGVSDEVARQAIHGMTWKHVEQLLPVPLVSAASKIFYRS